MYAVAFATASPFDSTRYLAVRYRGFPSLPLAARFTPGYLSFARFAAQEFRTETQ